MKSQTLEVKPGKKEQRAFDEEGKKLSMKNSKGGWGARLRLMVDGKGKGKDASKTRNIGNYWSVNY